MPSACAAMPMRPPSSVDMAIRNPSPTCPSSWPAGTRTPSKASCAVSEARMPSLRSLAMTAKPGLLVSTMKAAMPLCLSAGSVWANTISTSAWAPLVMKFFVPVSTQPSPSRAARVCWLAASVPALGSLRQ